MSFAFKKFNFLQHTEVTGHAFPKNATSSAASPRHLYIGCDNGAVHVLDTSFQLLCSFHAHAYRVFHVMYLEGRRLLLTVGSEEPGYSTAQLKLWDLPNILHMRMVAGAPMTGITPPQQPAKLVKVFTAKYPEGEITALTALELLPAPPGTATASATAPAASSTAGMVTALIPASMLGGFSSSTSSTSTTTGGVLAVALGLATGLVYVMHVDLPHTGGEASGRGSTAGAKVPVGTVTAAKPISVQKLSARPEAGHAWAVVGLALYGTDSDNLHLFVVTESQTLSFNLKASTTTTTKSVLDAQGAPSPGCAVLRLPQPHTPPAAAASTGGAGLREDEVDTLSGSHQHRLQQPMLLVARDEGLYNYTPDTRAGCTVLEGSKQRLLLLGRHVVVVTQEKSEVGTSSATVLILDLPHKLISGSLTLPSVTSVLSWSYEAGPVVGLGGAAAGYKAGSSGGVTSQKPLLVVATSTNKLYTFKEVPLAMQLESLFKRSLHKLALDLARVQHADSTTIAQIQQRWGDALYAKGDFDAAMNQYCETIGFLEPSYVIRRFLDAQRIHNLTAYLELLHEKGIAGADHTTLLLNCYTKLKDVEKLDAFIQRSVGGVRSAAAGSSSSTAGSNQAASASAAAEAGSSSTSAGKDKSSKDKAGESEGGRKALSRKGSKKAMAAAAAAAEDIDRKPGEGNAGPEGLPGGKPPELKFDAETAVKVLRAAGYPRHALTVAQAAGNADWQLDILLEDLQAWDEALNLMWRLPRAQCAAALRRCGKVLVTQRPEPTTSLIMDLCAPSNKSDAEAYAGSVADFAHLFCDAPTALMLLCEFILNTAPPGSIADERMLHHTLLELYLADSLDDGRSAKQQTAASQPDSGAAAGQPAGAAEGAPSAQPAAPATGGAAGDADRKDRRAKALVLLQSGWPPHLEQPKYDQEHALVLCRLAGFREGLVLLYDRLRLYREVMQVHMRAHDYPALVATALNYGDVARGGDPHLWVMLLEYLAAQTGPEVEAQVVEVVDHIEARGILPPIMVLQLLAHNKQLKVSSLRGYVSRFLSRESVEVARDREAAARLAADSAQLRAELSRLRSQARVFQSSRCAATAQPLELPAVHFLCGHAFNLRALGDNDKECPICAPDYKRVVEIRRNMAASALQQDRFFTELRESSDGFSVVADHFGRGLMNMTAAALSNVVEQAAPGTAQAARGTSGVAATSSSAISLAGLASMLAPST